VRVRECLNVIRNSFRPLKKVITIISFKKQIMTNLYTINFLPIILFHILLLPFWLISSLIDDLLVILMIIHISTTFLIPLIQVIYNGWFNIDNQIYHFLKNWILIVLATLLSHGMNYINWGIASREIFDPDSVTLLIMKWEVIISISIITLMACFQIIELYKIKRKR
jgi:hypothetical protein